MNASPATRTRPNGHADPSDLSNAHPVPPVSAAAPSPRWLIKAIVFVGGLSSIGAELAASRLVAPYFGSSTFIWATIIGLTLAFLSLGYWLGGRVADEDRKSVV